MSVAPGIKIADRYVVIEEIGAGGMGVVLRARDERLNRAVALKVLGSDAVGDEDARRRMVREARAAAALEHPNIVHVYDVGETAEGGAYLVMELVRGKTLGEHMREGTLSVAQRLHVIVEVARALAYAHEHGFVHRDIKPDNIMVREDGRAVVLDFGLAKVVAHGLGTTLEASLLSTKSTFVGTPAYVSPEQARGETLDSTSDQFSLAVSVFEAMTGELPWEGKTPLEVISHILRDVPRKLSVVAPELPAALGDALGRAMSKSQASRYATINDFADAIVAAVPDLEAQSMSAIASGPKRATAAAMATFDATSTSGGTVTAAPPKTWKKTVAFAALAVAFGVGSVGAYRLWPKPSAAPAVALVFTRATVIACPVLPSTDEVGPAPWLGAAAAALVCDRFQVAMGSTKNTRVPAELLNLPSEPKADFPTDSFDDPGVVAKTLAAAKGADFYVGGSVTYAKDFDVVLELKKGDLVVERGTGHAVVLVDAIRIAMTKMLPLVLPAVDQEFTDKWYAGTSLEARVDAFDLHVLVLNEDLPGLKERCDALKPRTDFGSLRAFITNLCTSQTFYPVPPIAYDTSSAGALLSSASTFRLHDTPTAEDRRANEEHAAKLGEMAALESSDAAKALLLAAAGEIDYSIGRSSQAAQAARLSIQASPKWVDIRGNAWHRQSFLSEVSNVAILSGHIAWVPWEAYGYSNRLYANVKTAEGARRAAILARRGYWALDYGIRLLERGDVDAARGVAAANSEDDRLNVLVLFATHEPGHALREATAALAALPAVPEKSPVAVRLAGTAVDIAVFLGKPTEPIAREFVDRFLMPEPPILSHGVQAIFSALDVCVQSPPAIGRRCFQRLNALFERGYFGAVFRGAREGMEGGRYYIEGDMAGAARIWRPYTAELIANVLRTPLALAFERTGEMDLAERVDTPPMKERIGSPEYDLSYARQALRAEKRKDMTRATELAQLIVDRWDSADERPPMVAEMKRILGKK